MIQCFIMDVKFDLTYGWLILWKLFLKTNSLKSQIHCLNNTLELSFDKKITTMSSDKSGRLWQSCHAICQQYRKCTLWVEIMPQACLGANRKWTPNAFCTKPRCTQGYLPFALCTYVGYCFYSCKTQKSASDCEQGWDFLIHTLHKPRQKHVVLN